MTRARILDVILLGCFISTLGVAMVADFSAGNQLEIMGQPIRGACFFRECFDIPCPFCGISRSFVAFMHGDILKSFSYHPLGPIVALTFAIFAVTAARSLLWRDCNTVESPLFSRVFIALAVAGLVLWPLRAFAHVLPSATSMVPR